MEQADKNRRKTGVAILSVASNTLLVIFKVVVGILIGSVSVISEAIHSSTDLIASVIALFAVRASGHKPDERHPYGHGKFENVSGVVEALLIFVAAAWIVYEAVHKLYRPQEVGMPVWGVGVMALSAVVNILVSRRLFKVGNETDSIALQADAWHLRTDVYTSVGVTVALLVVMIGRFVAPDLNLNWVDPAAAILVALLIFKAAYDLTRNSARDLLDVSLPHDDVSWIGDFIAENWPAVRSFHHLQTRKAGPYRFIDFHLVVEDRMPVVEAHALSDEIVAVIKGRVPESRVSIHVEPCDYQCKESCAEGCSVDEATRTARRTQLAAGQSQEAAQSAGE